MFYLCRGLRNELTNLNERMKVSEIRNFSRDNLRVASRFLAEERFDIAHVHSSAALPSLLLARVLGVGVVMHSHGDEPLRPVSLTLLRRVGMHASQRVIAVSRSTRAELIRRQGLSPEKVAVAYNGVNVDDFKPVVEPEDALHKYGLSASSKIVLSVGTVQQRKGQWSVIRCLPRMLEKWPNLVYVNVGSAYDSSYRNQILGEAERLGVARNVKLLSDVPQADLVTLINSADVCVHPSSREAFGLAVVEEMACGKPVVALSVGAMPEIIDNEIDGLLVQPGDLADLASGVLKLLSDSGYSGELGEAARRKVVTKFTWDQTAEALTQVYDGLLT